MIPISLATSFAAKHWKLIGGALLFVIMAAIIFVQSARLAGCHDTVKSKNDIIKTRDETIKGYVNNDKVQEQSITDLSIALDRKTAETDARAAALAKQIEDDAKSRAQSDLKAATTQKRLDALNRIARDGTSVCGVSDELRAALRGL